MHLRTPKRYLRGQKRSPISLRWLWLWVLTPIVVLVGLQIYRNRETLAPPVAEALAGIVNQAQNSLATVVAPTGTPTVNPADRLERAQIDWREGRIETAVNSYLDILDAVPNSVEVYYRAAFGLMMQGKYQDALRIAERTVTANPFSSDAWAVRAMALDRNNRYGESISSALRALEIDPNNARAMAFLAEAYLDNGNTELARSTADRALEVDPNSFEALRVRGLVAWLVEFDFVLAEDYFQQAYNAAPNLPYLGIELARMQMILGQVNGDSQMLQDALALLSDVVEVNPKNALALFELGTYYFRIEGNFSQAAEFLRRCVDAAPNSILCQGLLGRVQISLEDNAGAILSLQKAIDLGSTNAYHYLWMGRAQRAVGNCPAAVPFLEEALERAQRTQQEDIITVSQDLLRECQVAMGIALPTPTPEATPEAGGGA